ncbi:phosphatidylglycerophosphatase A family protein [Tuberibacillus sp. Marseille-P3662]|uniref:phosphatidylglycerophosphatase A family protein n=1 Tax=Tuberibacillus sp. Marseille-P3662 TaxID=1965358 RepID=UPI000A1CAB8E|nr:phosphatidylglycerophosphatase A [Tuberibacillus sp. Marseille-P3662]
MGDIVHETATKWLNERGVTNNDLAELVYFLQKDYHDGLTYETCLENVEAVLAKREVGNAILTGIQIDRLTEQGGLEEPLQDMLKRDEGLYGVDEIIAFSIVNVYGSIGFTNYGYIDKLKPGILKKLNDKSTGECHTFLDDIVGAIAAAASSRLAHGQQED